VYADAYADERRGKEMERETRPPPRRIERLPAVASNPRIYLGAAPIKGSPGCGYVTQGMAVISAESAWTTQLEIPRLGSRKRTRARSAFLSGAGSAPSSNPSGDSRPARRRPFRAAE